MAKIGKLTPEEAKNQAAFVNAQKIFSNVPKFNEQAIPHICSFLPKSTPAIETSVRLVAKIHPYAFRMNKEICIDVIASNYKNDIDYILNILDHEVYHVGQVHMYELRTEFTLEKSSLDFVINYLWSEGMADYVSYTAQSIFPIRPFMDYKMLENDKMVKLQIKNVNRVFSKANNLSPEKLRKLSWRVGVLFRAYYVAGAFMAKTIDEKLGRDSLVSCVSIGPRKFIHTYNSLVEEDMKIVEFEGPSKVSPDQYLRIALVKKDHQEVARLIEEMAQNKQPVDASMEGRINIIAYSAIDSEIKIAIEIFKLNVRLFPNSWNCYDGLGEAYMKADNKELAITNYKKSLELNPNSVTGKAAMEILEKK